MVQAMNRTICFIYGIFCYLMFLGVVVYFVGFLGNFATPTSIDGKSGSPPVCAIIVNLF